MTDRSPTAPAKCRSCGADILWAVTARGARMPVDETPDNRPPPRGGNLVLGVRNGTQLVVAMYDATKHDAKRNRYTSHFSTCPNADEHRVVR